MKKVFIGSLLALYCSTSFGGELKDRQQSIKHINDLFNQANYVELEKIYQHFRDGDVRTAGGVNALDEEFYMGILQNLRKKSKYLPQTDVVWKKDEKSLKKWMQMFPTSPAPHLIYADLFSQRAWAYRGNGYSNTVSQENWKHFHHYIDLEQKYLNSIKALSKLDPRWYVLALDAAKDRDVDETSYKKLLNEATSKYPTYLHIYYAATTHYLPKWGGSIEAIDDLAKYASKKTQQSDGESFYARVYWTVEGECDCDFQGQDLFKKTSVNWSRMKKGLVDIIVKYPSDWNITHSAYLTCQANDQQLAAELFKRIPNYVPENWNHHFKYLRCKAFAENKMDEYLKLLPNLDSDGWPIDPKVQIKSEEYQAAYKTYEKATEADPDQKHPLSPENLKQIESRVKSLSNIYRQKYAEYLEAQSASEK